MKAIIAVMFLSALCSHAALKSPRAASEQTNAPMASPKGLVIYRLYECAAPNIVTNQIDFPATITEGELNALLNSTTRYFRLTTIDDKGFERVWLNRN